jgi:hypothetical protein
MKNLTTALIKSQKEIKNAAKDAKNPHFRNDYATLESVIEAVKDIANNNEIAIVQLQGRDERGDYLQTSLMHASGESLNSRCYLEIEKPTMQALGSAITYARRYNLASIFCITQEDDDGNRASSKPQERSSERAAVNSKNTNDIGDFTTTVGKFKGKRLKEIEPRELVDYCKYITTGANEVTGPMKIFIDNARTYLSGANA